jgi:hypothetical protein
MTKTNKPQRVSDSLHTLVRCFRSIGLKRTQQAMFELNTKEDRDEVWNVVLCKIAHGLQLDEGLEQFAIFHSAYEAAETLEWAKRIHTPNDKAQFREERA